MEPDAIGLEELVVVGYGTQKKRDLTGSVVSVKNEDVVAAPTSNVMEALQGKIAGLDITKSSGQVGGGVNILLRGSRSIYGDNSPLFIIDGLPGSYDDISPNDIESIDVLKDASSTAIYGSAGANGVIIITTKRGAKSSKTRVNFDAYYGWSGSPEYKSGMTGDEWVNYYTEAYKYKNGVAPASVSDLFGGNQDYVDAYNAGELPISVKPDKQVSVTDVMALLRETYEGTPLDMTQNLKVTVKDRKTGKVDTIISPKANPWMRGDELNMLNGIKKGVVKSVRNIAVPQCAYSTVIQLRNWLPDAVGGVVWFSMDNPGQSPRVPVFCGITDFPAMYKICGNHRYRDDAALWHYRRANKLAAVRWGTARKVMEKNIRHFEEKGQRELPFVEAQYQSILQSKGEEAARAYLTDYTADFIGATILRWDEMANQYWIESRFGF